MGKERGFDTDIHIPLIVRGPGVAAGRISHAVTSHTDLAPTILELAGTDRDDFDGLSLLLSSEDVLKPSKVEHVNVEYWGMAIPEGRLGHYGGVKDGWAGYAHAARNNTYKALRLIGENYSLYYSVWCTGDMQFYDMKVSLAAAAQFRANRLTRARLTLDNSKTTLMRKILKSNQSTCYSHDLSSTSFLDSTHYSWFSSLVRVTLALIRGRCFTPKGIFDR